MVRYAIVVLILLAGFAAGWSGKGISDDKQPPQKSFADRALLAAKHPDKQIHVREGMTPGELTRRISKGLPTLERNPEAFIPAYAYCQFVMQDGQPIPAEIDYTIKIPTQHGTMELKGKTWTNEKGWFGLLVPDGVDADIKVTRIQQ
jgi:hypothetical protein